ncbi:hypothetical protein PIB30_070454 [Stylosanthes scabra]|uniref:Uncharacterized protein n=1 Tax=Stylosanthes scabra TaxID=79078 RepID=A0ABU6QN21_9FABA|nr:hypothetical protein [Stylosanthes scabra]
MAPKNVSAKGKKPINDKAGPLVTKNKSQGVKINAPSPSLSSGSVVPPTATEHKKMDIPESSMSQRKKDDYHLSLQLIEQARFLPGYNPMGVGVEAFSKVYHPSPEDIQVAKILQENPNAKPSNSEPPDPGRLCTLQNVQNPYDARVVAIEDMNMVADSSITSVSADNFSISKLPTIIDVRNPFGIRTLHRQVHWIVSSNKE